ncbi:hypothetical protein QR680_004847 [Steinernema hermaphroditum]|uniref:Antistasin-like domain-containing protein n=1 Tax=Steinernema hermaphroditum TaxID=289476 RepID=A0AA39HR47_9BILA|nr:hypothetical protein QR680_004847 [Steinernema hermaphroditum]
MPTRSMAMRGFLVPFLLLSLLVVVAESISCCSGRPACLISCNVQNCATGYCTEESCSGTCRCSRCGSVPDLGRPGRRGGGGRRRGGRGRRHFWIDD